MLSEDFIRRCRRGLWHVGPVGSWDRIRRTGFRTAQQLIDAATLDDERRTELSDRPRRHEVVLDVDGEEVRLRDQGPLFERADLTPLLEPGMTVSDWVRLLNSRVYLFRDLAGRQRILDKYGTQDVVTVDPQRLLAVVGDRVELADQNTGAIARRTDPYKRWDTFRTVAGFAGDAPKEVTVRDGLTPDELRSVVTAVQRHHGDGSVVDLVTGH